jgi:hypothetical protein
LVLILSQPLCERPFVTTVVDQNGVDVGYAFEHCAMRRKRQSIDCGEALMQRPCHN